MKYYRDIKNVVDTSREEGVQEGIEQGIEQGIEKKTLEFAKKMKEKNESVDKIMEYTGLSREEIQRL